jgi:hypothetical protein
MAWGHLVESLSAAVRRAQGDLGRGLRRSSGDSWTLAPGLVEEHADLVLARVNVAEAWPTSVGARAATTVGLLHRRAATGRSKPSEARQSRAAGGSDSCIPVAASEEQEFCLDSSLPLPGQGEGRAARCPFPRQLRPLAWPPTGHVAPGQAG